MVRHKSKKYECELCNRTFPNIGKVENHLEYRHGIKTTERKNATYECLICDIKFKSFHALESHSVKSVAHGKRNPLKCHICLKCFKSEGACKIHVVSHKRSKFLECDICGKIFSENKKFDIHRKFHSDPPKCKICNKTFASKNSLKKHETSCTSAVKDTSSKCEKCGKSFKSKGACKAHEKFCKGTNQEVSEENINNPNEDIEDTNTFKCETCCIYFHDESSKKIHFLSYEHCKNYSATFQMSLGQKDFREGNVESHHCGKCEREFSNAENLQDHMRRHENQCEICDKKFDNLWALKFHDQAMHSIARI